MGHFAVLDPLVEEICLLTDGLRHALARKDEEPHVRRVAYAPG